MKSPYVITILLFLAAGCQKKALIHVAVDEESDLVSLNITDPHVNGPLQLAPNQEENKGNILFWTNKDTFSLKGEPEIIQNDETWFTGEWTVHDRIASVTLSKHEKGYSFIFNAQPDDNIMGWGFNMAATEHEYFTGLFERTVDGPQTKSWKEGIEIGMDLRGQAVDMIIKPTLSLYSPFYLSSNGYGLFIEGTWPGHYDLCREHSNLVQIRFEGPSISGSIYTAKEPADIVKTHSINVGPSIIPPKWAFLPYRWRDNHSNSSFYYDSTAVHAPYNSMIVEDILMMEAFDIPCGIYWIDRPWATGTMGYDDYKWDRQRFPNPQEMINWLDKKDIKLLLWIAPWVDGNMADTAIKRDYHVPKKDNEWTQWAEENQLVLIDFTNEAAKTWWQSKGPGKMLQQGIKGFKLDRSEELVPETRDITYANGKTAREMRNAYPVEYVKATNEVCKEIHGDNFVIFPRAGYTGSSKYGVFWGGDIGSPPEGLRAAVIAAQRSAIIGYPLWGSDIGGYWHGPMDREVTARWLAFGCFNPIMEFGPTRNRGPWDMPSEPTYDTALIATWRLYATIHKNLVDYSHNLAVEANATGMPAIRPLFLEYPKQQKAWEDWQTFMYGSDILISVIWRKNVTNHTCYLPDGEKWIDAWDETRIYEGGQEIQVKTPFHKIPIFIRDGAKVNLGNLNEIYTESLELASRKPDLQKLEKKIR